ncbi:LOW QUALITY PROTEIN: hypothetical protein GQ55_3G027800 [Panicum hallii var. hallii]|uniref:DWNN domain-containing protein n=1 Tax=Panicum hallii var. hallii TaxID=1504633 RepID=A0A2T7E539_9POAL|nr:LOW QUALITY PROTEIN: hypothetical protein GQ55_3G027800 [Panicum hallii var. hallii]
MRRRRNGEPRNPATNPSHHNGASLRAFPRTCDAAKQPKQGEKSRKKIGERRNRQPRACEALPAAAPRVVPSNKTMAVHYRYKSDVQTSSVPMPTPSVSVADLKNLILRTARHGHGRTRGRGGRASCCTTRGPARSTRTAAHLSPQLNGAVASSPPKATTRDGVPSDSAVTSSSSAEDDEARAISAVIDAAQLKCRVPGHFIQHCPTNGDPRYDLGRASSKINPLLVDPIPDDRVPPELHCKICSKVMVDAVVASRCCFGSFCDVCIRGHIAAKSSCVCGAQSRAADLIPNLTLCATIAKLLATSAPGSGSVGTDNRKSSAGSNAEPTTSQSVAASQESRSHGTAAAGSEHSGGSASSTSKSAAAPAACEARSKHATAESVETGAHAGYLEQYGYYRNPFGPACYDPFLGAAPWACDPYMYYGMPYGGGYTNVPTPAGYHDGCHGRKRMADGEFQRHGEAGLKRRCGGGSEVAF